MILRPEIRNFAEAMEMEMRKKDALGYSDRGISWIYLKNKLDEERKEVDECIEKEHCFKFLSEESLHEGIMLALMRKHIFLNIGCGKVFEEGKKELEDELSKKIANGIDYEDIWKWLCDELYNARKNVDKTIEERDTTKFVMEVSEVEVYVLSVMGYFLSKIEWKMPYKT